MGGKLSKEELFAHEYLNEYVFDKIKIPLREQKRLKTLILTNKRFVKYNAGEILLTENKPGAAHFLLSGKLLIGNHYQNNPCILGAETLWNIDSFKTVKSITNSSLIRLNPRCNLALSHLKIFSLFVKHCPIITICEDLDFIQKYMIPPIPTATLHWWRSSQVASMLDRTLDLSKIDEQWDMTFRPDFVPYLEQIIDHYEDKPKLFSVPYDKDDKDKFIIQERYELASNCIIMVRGSVRIEYPDEEDDDDPVDEDDDITEECILFEEEVVLEKPTEYRYVAQPGTLLISVSRSVTVCIQFMKVFNMNADEAIRATKHSYVRTLNTGDIIHEDRWFKGIIYTGKLQLTALPPGRASEHEQKRRSTLTLKPTEPPKPRRSCRIAVELDCGFVKCGPFDEFQASSRTIVLITTGIDEPAQILEDEEPHHPDNTLQNEYYRAIQNKS